MKCKKGSTGKHQSKIMPTIEEETLELNELAEIEGEFIEFVLPWLKLVPPRLESQSTKSYKVSKVLPFFGCDGD